MKQEPKKQIRIWAMWCHISALFAWIFLFFLVFLGIPLYLPLNLMIPMIIWRFQKTKSPWIDFQGKESLNFQISLTFYTLIIVIISLLLLLGSFGMSMTTNDSGKEIKTVLDGLLLVWMTLIAVMLIIQSYLVTSAALKAYRGKHYRYPLTMRILR